MKKYKNTGFMTKMAKISTLAVSLGTFVISFMHLMYS